MFARAMVTLNHLVLSLRHPLISFHWWVEPAVKLDVCHQPTAGAAFGLVCVVIFSPQDRSHFGVVLVTVGGSYNKAMLWCLFQWSPVEGSWEGGGFAREYRDGEVVLAMSVLVCCERRLGAALENSCQE